MSLHWFLDLAVSKSHPSHAPSGGQSPFQQTIFCRCYFCLIGKKHWRVWWQWEWIKSGQMGIRLSLRASTQNIWSISTGGILLSCSKNDSPGCVKITLFSSKHVRGKEKNWFRILSHFWYFGEYVLWDDVQKQHGRPDRFHLFRMLKYFQFFETQREIQVNHLLIDLHVWCEYNINPLRSFCVISAMFLKINIWNIKVQWMNV